MVEGDYTALTLVEMIDRRVGLPLSRGERVWGRVLFCGDEKLGCMVERELVYLMPNNNFNFPSTSFYDACSNCPYP